MFSFFGLLVMFGLLFRVCMIIYRVVNKVSSYQESTEISSALFVKKGTTGAEYLEMASNAMIYENKNVEGVKELLRSKGMYEENIDLYAKKAKERYDQWLNENGGQPILTSRHESDDQAILVDPAITMGSTPGEDHAHHFCALIGKKRYYIDWGREILYNVTDAALKNGPVTQNDDTSISQSSFKKYGGAELDPQLRVVAVKGQQETVFPYLKTDIVIPFQTKKIIEWENNVPLEAEIQGVWSSEFSLGFFATDYAVNKHIYMTKPNINVKLSAFVLEISGSERDKDNLESRENIAGYWPSDHYGLYSYFAFEGILEKLTPADVDIISKGGILTLKVIDNKQGKDLTIDAYVTASNISAPKLHQSRNVTGTLWFQGELAN